MFTFPHWALVESRMGPLWHGTRASAAYKRKYEGSKENGGISQQDIQRNIKGKGNIN